MHAPVRHRRRAVQFDADLRPVARRQITLGGSSLRLKAQKIVSLVVVALKADDRAGRVDRRLRAGAQRLWQRRKPIARR